MLETVLVVLGAVVAVSLVVVFVYSDGVARRRVAELAQEAQSLRRAWAEAEAQYARQAAALAEERSSRQEWQRLSGDWRNQSQAWETQADELRAIAEGFRDAYDRQQAELEQLKLQLQLRPIVDATKLLVGREWTGKDHARAGWTPAHQRRLELSLEADRTRKRVRGEWVEPPSCEVPF